MKRPEVFSRILVLVGLVLAAGVPLAFWAQTPLVHARISEEGGWTPGVLRVEAGQILHLSLTSDDVVHGFAVGQMEIEPVDIEPGKVTNITLTFARPGIYTFYCTRWCGRNHWRMRGTIEVSGPGSGTDSSVIPLYVTLGIDIDEPHVAPVVPGRLSSAVNGRELILEMGITQINDPVFYRQNSPYQAFEALNSVSLSDPEKWDVVSALWLSYTSPDALDSGKSLYARNCAACHGENGAGDGVFADDLATGADLAMQTMDASPGMPLQRPADFTDPEQMLGASPAVLQGKLLRGGMGTGMPMWGSIFTEQQLWDLTAYLYSFQFDYDNEGD